MIHLVLGGARSGKSRFAQEQVKALEKQSQKNQSPESRVPVTYVATATAFDEEMQARIQRHQEDRPSHWQTAEVPLALTEFIKQQTTPAILLVDCLTLWLNNQLYHYPEQNFEELFEQLADSLCNSPCDIILVANEVGLGVIPMGEISRKFVDQAGWLNQKIAAIADKVTLVSAGLPLPLKTYGYISVIT